MQIIEALTQAKSDTEFQESWGEPVDVTEFMTDSIGFFNTNGLGAFTQIYDRSDGRYRPVYTNESDLKLIRAMSWLLVEKVPMAQAWVNRLLDYTVGTGFDWTVKHESKPVQQALQAFVRTFMDNSKWSSELERESYIREISDGEFLANIEYEEGDCMLLTREPDELTEPAIKGELEEWLNIGYEASWTFGVLTKKNVPERPRGYHFVRDPAGLDWDYVCESSCVHWKRNVRSRAKRGYSDFYKPHLYLLRADRVLTNTAEGAATQAAIAYIVEHAATSTQARAENLVAKFAAPTGRVDPLTGLAERRRRMRPGTRLDVPAGQQYKSGLLGSNNSQIYIDVLESALRLAGSVHAFPEGMLTGSYQNANFASSLTAEGPFVQGRVAEQMQRAERMREMILKAVRHAAKRGRFKRVGIAAFEEMELGLTIEVVPSRVLPRDPDKLAQSLAIQKQNGWVSDKTAINELGRDIDVEVANGLKVGQKPGEEQKQDAATEQAQQSKPQEQATDGRWLGLSRMQWQRNRKAVADVLNDFASGKTRRQVAKVLLRSVGMPDPDIETMLRDASDGTIETLPPEEFTAVTEAERKTLNRPFRTPDGPKKFAVYVKNDKGNVVKVTFGDPKMSIKRDDPGARRGFRARHNCSNSGPKWKARYWSCRFWSKPSVSKLLKESFEDGCLAWDGRTFVNESWLLKTNPQLLEVRCPTGKGGGIKNTCKRKTKKAATVDGTALHDAFKKSVPKGSSQTDKLDYLAKLSDDERSVLAKQMRSVGEFDSLDKNDFAIAKRRHARLYANSSTASSSVSKKDEASELEGKRQEWFSYLGSNGIKPKDLEEFSTSGKSGYDALHAFVHGGFADMNSDPNGEASQAMRKVLRSIPPTSHSGPMYRVLGFADDKARDAFVSQLQKPQEKTFASWAYADGDPSSEKATPMNNIGLDLAASFGDKIVVLRHANAASSSAKDVSFAYQTPNGNPKLKQGTELITGNGHKLKVLGQKLVGDKLVVDVSTDEVGSHSANRVSEAFCATGKGGKRNPHCSPKNKGKGKQKPQPAKKRPKAEDSKESPRTQSSVEPKDFERPWEDETKTILERQRSLGIDAYRLSQKEHQREFLKLHEAYHSDKYRKEAIGEYDEMLKNANAGIPDEATREVATQELKVSMRDDYNKQNPNETARKKLSDFTPDEEAIKSRMIAWSKRIAKEEIANWEYQRDLVSDRSKKAKDDASAKDAQKAALRSIEHRSKAAHLASVAEALRRGKDVSPGNVLAYLGSDRMPKEETAAFMKKYGSQTTNAMLKAFDSTGRRFQKDVLDSLEYGSQFRSKFLEASQKQNEAVKQRWDEIDRLNKEATNVTNEFSAFKEQAASKLQASGISTIGPVVTFADTRKLPDDHPIRVQYDSYVEKVKGIAVLHQQTLDSINSGQSQAGVHALLAHGDAATANLEVGHWGGQKTEAKVKSATEFLKTVVHPSLMPNGMKVTAALNMDLNDQRAYAKVDEAEIVMSSDDSVDTWVHEIGHVIESNSAVSDGPKMSKTFLYNRARFTQDKEVPEAAHLGGRYGFNEQRVEDKLNRPYAEKWYPDNATEVISMGVEALYSDPVKFATEHPDHFDYTISFLHGKVVQKTPDEPSGDVPEA